MRHHLVSLVMIRTSVDELYSIMTNKQISINEISINQKQNDETLVFCFSKFHVTLLAIPINFVIEK